VLLASQPVGALLALVIWIFLGAGTERPADGELLAAAGAGMCVMTGVGLLYRAMLTGALGIVATVAGLGVLLPVLVGLLNGEQPSLLAGLGIGCAIVAVTFVASSSSDWRDSGLDRTSLCLALLAALGFGGFFVLMNEAADASVSWATFAARVGAIAVLATAAALIALRGGFAGWRRPARAEWPPLVAIAAFDLGGTIAFAHATTLGLLPLVAAIASLHSVATIGLAHVFAGEQIRGRQRYGVVLALVAVALITSQG
jgi:drug/metabolite transporter (DMT)-like permease